MMELIDQNFVVIISVNMFVIDKWVVVKVCVVKMMVDVVEYGDLCGLVKYMGDVDGFFIIIIGWIDKLFLFISSIIFKDYDFIVCFWYKEVIVVGKLFVMKFYGDVFMGVKYVLFFVLLMCNGEVIGVVSGVVLLDCVCDVVVVVYLILLSLVFVVVKDG